MTHWSDVATSNKDVDPNAPTREERLAELHKMAAYFTRLWNERVNASPGSDLISMMAHNPETRNMTPQEFMGNLVLLIVGGNDTTRNSMTGGLLALHNNPAEWDKLRKTRLWWKTWFLKSSDGKLRWPTCAVPPCKIRSWVGNRSRKATKS